MCGDVYVGEVRDGAVDGERRRAIFGVSRRVLGGVCVVCGGD